MRRPVTEHGAVRLITASAVVCDSRVARSIGSRTSIRVSLPPARVVYVLCPLQRKRSLVSLHPCGNMNMLTFLPSFPFRYTCLIWGWRLLAQDNVSRIWQVRGECVPPSGYHAPRQTVPTTEASCHACLPNMEPLAVSACPPHISEMPTLPT